MHGLSQLRLTTSTGVALDALAVSRWLGEQAPLSTSAPQAGRRPGGGPGARAGDQVGPARQGAGEAPWTPGAIAQYFQGREGGAAPAGIKSKVEVEEHLQVPHDAAAGDPPGQDWRRHLRSVEVGVDAGPGGQLVGQGRLQQEREEQAAGVAGASLDGLVLYG